jgi:hypothetical protein
MLAATDGSVVVVVVVVALLAAEEEPRAIRLTASFGTKAGTKAPDAHT